CNSLPEFFAEKQKKTAFPLFFACRTHSRHLPWKLLGEPVESIGHSPNPRSSAAIKLVLEKAAAEEQGRLAAEQRERERLEAEQREKERLADEQRERERLEAEHGQLKSNILPPSPAPLQHRGPVPAETPATIESEGSAVLKSLTLRAPIVVLALILIVGLIWFAGSKLSHSGPEAALATPTSTPTPT